MLKEELNTLDSLYANYEADFARVAKKHLRDYVASVTNPVPRFGSNAYICPCCGSGSGKNNHYTPAFFLFQAADGTPLFKCHSCDVSGDIFTLAGLVNNINDFPGRQKIVADFLGVDLAARTPLSEISVPKAEAAGRPRTQRETLRLKQQTMTYITECRKHIHETDYFHLRGLTDKTVERFRLGYDPERQMAIIPFTSTYYIGRRTTIGADESGPGKHYKPSGLRQPIFNLAALSERRDPVFLTEAPLDAISIMQAGGRAMALGGTAVSILKTILDVYRPKNVFILAFDQDGPGRRLEGKVISLLEERDVPYSRVTHPVFTSYKDANAALLGDSNAFKEAVTAETERAKAFVLEPDSPQPVPDSEAKDVAFEESVSKEARQAAQPRKSFVETSRTGGR